MQAFVPEMLKQDKGHIVGIASVAGLVGLKNLVPYCGTKFAVYGMMEAFAEELRTTHPNSKVKYHKSSD